MLRFLWISSLFSIVTSTKCDNDTTTFTCSSTTIDNVKLGECKQLGHHLGCLYKFKLTSNGWEVDAPIEAITVDIPVGNKECQNETNSSFSIRVFDEKEINVTEALRQCKYSIKCEDESKVGWPPQGMEWACVLTLENIVNNGSLKRKSVEAQQVTKNKNGNIACSINETNHTIVYKCSSGDDCHKQVLFKTHDAPEMEQCKGEYCPVYPDYPLCSAKQLGCGGRVEVVRRDPRSYCHYTWTWTGNNYERKSNFLYSENFKYIYFSTCARYEARIKEVYCEDNCTNLTVEDIQSDEYCGAEKQANGKKRQAISIVSAILMVFLIGAVVYAGCSTCRKAQKAHALLLHEYSTEFGSNPMSTEEDKHVKKKRKDANGGKKGKKVKGEAS